MFRKLGLVVFILNVCASVALYFLVENWVSVALIILGFSLFVYFCVYFFYFRPQKKIFLQMQLLITGKPYNRILTSRVDEVGVMAHFFNQVTKTFGEVSHDIKDRERILGELSVATQLQQDILPKENPKLPGLDIVAKTKPASELGGDSFNFITVDNRTYIYIGDVTGHGAAAGLIMTMVNSLIAVFVELFSSPYDVLVNVNKHIKKHVKKAMFMTLVMFFYDHNTQKMSFVGAGHEHILIYRKKTGKCESILSGGVALGMVPDNSNVIKEIDLPLENGDFVVLYSDGITEAKNMNGEMYGLDKLIDAVVEYAPQYTAEGLNYHIARDHATFMSGTDQEDDITLIVMQKHE